MQHPCTLTFQTPRSEPAVFLLANFLRQSTPSVLGSSKTNPKCLNYSTCYTRVLSTLTTHTDPSSPSNTITISLIFIVLQNTSLTHFNQQNVPSSPSGSLPILPTNPVHLHMRGQAISPLSPLPKLSLPSSQPTITVKLPCINLSLCSFSVLPFLSWSGLSSFHGNDHFPILVIEVSQDASPAP